MTYSPGIGHEIVVVIRMTSRVVCALLLIMALISCSEEVRPHARTYWGDKPDSTVLPTAEDTGQAVATMGGVPGLIASGLLTMTAPTSGGAGLYRVFGAAEPITRVGARFTFGSRVVGTTTSGVVALVMTNKSYSPTDPAVELNVHVYIGPTNWGLQSKVDGVWSVLASGTFTPPLSIDDTVYTADVYRVGDTVTVVLPDGGVSTTSNAVFRAGDWGYVETAMTAPTDNIPGILENWWDIGDQHPPPARS
ncbi:hypothetical protein CIW49_15795 [Mycolicibacterium sp. P1-18]|uniref:hypothetical protein n=1 Tax=Mycolicibacterium sp. P1-18 TaxID=2024615 RepID=UPI0011F3961B|nr:hypothetical protein [Mycolicibacterium sp. P1-18]KAA0098116.1 hypothetical protein CIW49_15795 [Mycolicibacterium sp. P1-18]